MNLSLRQAKLSQLFTGKSSARFLFWATIILLLASVMRLTLLEAVPPGLAQDEILDADIASFIRAGQHAFFFRDGFGHEPLYHYWAAPFAPLIGDNILALRLPSVILGLFVVALTLRWARREFGNLAALVAGAGVALSWWPIIFSRIGIRPIMEPFFLLLTAWFWPKRPWLAGAFLGLSVYTYTGARVVYLIPILLIATALTQWRRSPIESQTASKQALIVLLMALLVSAPMLLTLWADPTLQQRVDQLSGPLDSLREGDVAPIVESTLRTLGVATFSGDPRSTYSWPDRPLFDFFSGFFFYGGFIIALWHWRERRYRFILAWLAVTLLPSAITPQAPSTVRLIGALPLIYLMPGLALGWLQNLWSGQKDKLRSTTRKGVVYLFVATLLMLLGLNLGRTIRDGFVRWPNSEEVRLNHYQATFWAIAQHYESQGIGQLVVADSFYEPIDNDSLRRSAGSELPVRWIQEGGALGGALVIPAGANNLLYIPEYASPPATLLELANMVNEPIYRHDGFPSFVVHKLPDSLTLPRQSAPIIFNDALRFLGSIQEIETAEQPAPIYTYWQVIGPLPADLAIFIHVVDEQGNIVSQHDGLDAAPAQLQPGDYLIQRHIFASLEASASLQLNLYLGVYTRAANIRWIHDGTPEELIPLTPGRIDR